ncbi:MAG: MarR family transcriptional regulator [Eubacteriales bacterium]|nr:MarR family transcriptional regulator [Eubacteriales bacterium]
MEEKHIVGYEIHTLDNMIGRLISAQLEKEGLTHMQSWIIRYLYENSGQNIFQKDLEAEFHIARSTASGILQLMEKRGLITRGPVPGDARLKRLVLTEKGIDKQLSVMQLMSQVEEFLQNDISDEEMDSFIDTIHHMKRTIETKTI